VPATGAWRAPPRRRSHWQSGANVREPAEERSHPAVHPAHHHEPVPATGARGILGSLALGGGVGSERTEGETERGKRHGGQTKKTPDEKKRLKFCLFIIRYRLLNSKEI